MIVLALKRIKIKKPKNKEEAIKQRKQLKVKGKIVRVKEEKSKR